jgi:hypothetical protein
MSKRARDHKGGACDRNDDGDGLAAASPECQDLAGSRCATIVLHFKLFCFHCLVPVAPSTARILQD